MKCAECGKNVLKLYDRLCVHCAAAKVMRPEFERLKAKMGDGNLSDEAFMEKLRKEAEELPDDEPADLPEIEPVDFDAIERDIGAQDVIKKLEDIEIEKDVGSGSK